MSSTTIEQYQRTLTDLRSKAERIKGQREELEKEKKRILTDLKERGITSAKETITLLEKTINVAKEKLDGLLAEISKKLKAGGMLEGGDTNLEDLLE